MKLYRTLATPSRDVRRSTARLTGQITVSKQASFSMAHYWAFCLSLLVLRTIQASGHDCTVTNISSIETLINCPGFTVQLDFHETSHQVEVRCSNKPNFELLRDLQNLPKFKFQQLAYKYCPLPVGNRSLVDHLSIVLDRSQLSSINTLFFVDNAKLSEEEVLDPQLFAGLDKLTTLSMKNSTRMPLDNPMLFEHLPSITILDLRRGDGGSRVATGLLQPLTKLAELELMENGLTTLPSELVSRLPNLKTLTLYQNKLERIEQFDELPSLTTLDFTSNQLATLQEDVFERLPELTKLVLKSNNLTSLPSRLLRNNTKLTTFVADYQRGQGLVLEDELFAGLQMLQTVSLIGCKIAHLPAGLFTGATKLTKVSLSNNRLQTLPANLFRDLSNLRELFLQHNELNTLPDTLLNGAAQLRIINLSHNYLTSLSGELLQSQRVLEELHLEHNQLHKIDVRAFKSQSESLKKLIMSNNNVSLRENGQNVMYENGNTFLINRTPFHELNRIIELDLSHN
uniref:Leucine rich immune protein (Coil-less) n=1 Tax=Anopheles epiroticus TaxID=199890 RepID=A0A182PWR3_9DIPT